MNDDQAVVLISVVAVGMIATTVAVVQHLHIKELQAHLDLVKRDRDFWQRKFNDTAMKLKPSDFFDTVSQLAYDLKFNKIVEEI